MSSSTTGGLFWSSFILCVNTRHLVPRLNWTVGSWTVWKGRRPVAHSQKSPYPGSTWQPRDLLGKAASPHLHCPQIRGLRNLRNGPASPQAQSVSIGRQVSRASGGCIFHCVCDKLWAVSELLALCSVVWDLLTSCGTLRATCPFIYNFYGVFCAVINWLTLQPVRALIRKLSSKWITFSVAVPSPKVHCRGWAVSCKLLRVSVSSWQPRPSKPRCFLFSIKKKKKLPRSCPLKREEEMPVFGQAFFDVSITFWNRFSFWNCEVVKSTCFYFWPRNILNNSCTRDLGQGRDRSFPGGIWEPAT